MTPEQRAALLVLREQIEESMDGGEECRGHDARMTRWQELVNIALGNYVDSWAARFHEPAIKEQMGKA